MIVVCNRISLLLVLSVAVVAQSNLPLSSTSQRNVRSSSASRSGRKTKYDESFVRTVEASLLNIFGLKSRPRPSKDTQIPQYMLDLYNLHSRKPGTVSPFMKTKGKGLLPANTIRSFYHVDGGLLSGCRANACVRIWFNVSTIPDSEDLSAAELRVFKDVHDGVDSPRLRRAAGADGAAGIRGGKSTRLKLEVHEIMQPPTQNSECISRLIDTKSVDFRNSSWESFDVHSAVLRWKSKPRFNHGLEVRVLSNDPSLSAEAHVRLRRSATAPEHEWQTLRPLLVTYTDDGKNPKSRTKRGARSKRRKNKRKKRRRKKGHKNHCRRHALYVDFNDVGWNDWIVAPTGYNAFYCHGKCPFPLAHHLNSTNHAIVQTLVNSVNPTAVPEACCVPTELSAISMLYLDEWEKIVLKNYKDMVVEACGCR